MHWSLLNHYITVLWAFLAIIFFADFDKQIMAELGELGILGATIDGSSFSRIIHLIAFE